MGNKNSKPYTFFQAVNLELERGFAVSEAIRLAIKKYPALYEAYLRLGGTPDNRFPA